MRLQTKPVESYEHLYEGSVEKRGWYIIANSTKEGFEICWPRSCCVPSSDWSFYTHSVHGQVTRGSGIFEVFKGLIFGHARESDELEVF